MSQWWILDGPLPGGVKISGPYNSQDDAIAARREIEQERAPQTFWVDWIDPEGVAP